MPSLLSVEQDNSKVQCRLQLRLVYGDVNDFSITCLAVQTVPQMLSINDCASILHAAFAHCYTVYRTLMLTGLLFRSFIRQFSFLFVPCGRL